MRAALESLLTRAWLQRGWLAWLLLPLTAVYALASALHRWWFRHGPGQAGRVSIPVIVVGNVVAGGAGKTPIVMALVRHLRARGWEVGIASRGHGRRHADVRLVQAQSSADDVGDEPLLLAQRCQVPVAVGRRRLDAVRALQQAHPAIQVVVCDDGLQHHALHHDIALCVFDERGLGNGWLLPSGPLREPWPRSQVSDSVQFVVSTGESPDVTGHRVQRQLATHAINGRGDSRALSHWRGQTVTALAGIAHPSRFFAMLQQQGLKLGAALGLPDHASASLLSQAVQQAPATQALLCTEKDAVKLWPEHPEVWAVPLDTRLPDELIWQIDASLTAKLSSPHGQQTA
jgi:tetraacyldisaccharide 4'-kinase